jgi:uncharacterized protein YqgC (DUF456 family)
MNLDPLWWFLVGALVVTGVVGSLLPLLPGTTLIAVAALVYQGGLAGADRRLGMGTIWGLFGLLALSYLIDFMASLWGAKRFGASRLGMVGGLLGLGVGFFFNLPGLLLGPPLGVISGELLSGRPLPAAFRVAWGTVVGTALGAVFRLGISLVMTAWLGWAIWRATHPAP